MLNKTILMGRLVRDPEKKYVGDYTVANFTLAVDRDRKNSDGARETDFIDCAAWGRLADFVIQWFNKGAMAIVVGRLQSNSWTDKNGNKRVSISVRADEVNFGETKKSRDANRPGPAPGQAAAPDPLAGVASDTDFAELDDDSDVPF